MLKLLTAVAILIMPLAACGDPENRVREEGNYGASSGPNPNLSDLQEQPPVDPVTQPDPASPSEAANPSQAAQTPPPPITGRSSAQTPATDRQN
jgi:hypothetical protein